MEKYKLILNSVVFSSEDMISNLKLFHIRLFQPYIDLTIHLSLLNTQYILIYYNIISVYYIVWEVFGSVHK